MMKKTLTLSIITLLIAGFVIGFIYINHKIEIGNTKITSGEQQFLQGKKALSEGKVTLLKGEEKLKQGKRMYQEIKKTSLLAVVMAPVAGAVMLTSDHVIGKKIASGETQVEIGKEKIKMSEERLSKGKLELSDGLAELNFAKILRMIFAFGAVLGISLLICLKIYW